MTTPDELADRARVDRWIASWNAKQILAYDKQVAKREELNRKCEERERAKDDGFVFPERLKEWEAEHDWGEHIRRRFPVGAFFDNVEEDRRPGPEDFMRTAETGADLFYAAICAAADKDDTEFFIKAYERWGELVDTALQECSLQNRDAMTGRVRASR
jgi:hypothetical protein